MVEKNKKKTSTTKKDKSKPTKKKQNELKKEIITLISLALSIFVIICIYSQNAGSLGVAIKNITIGTMGISAYIIPIYILLLCLFKMFGKLSKNIRLKFILVGIELLLISIFTHIINGATFTGKIFEKISSYYSNSSYQSGGIIGGALGDLLLKSLGVYGTYVILIAFSIIILVLLTEKSFLNIIYKILTDIRNLYSKIISKIRVNYNLSKESKKALTSSKTKSDNIVHKIVKENQPEIQAPTSDQNNIKIKSFDTVEKEHQPKVVEEKSNIINNIQIMKDNIDYKYPSIDLLNKNKQTYGTESKAQILKSAHKLEKALESFGVKAKVVQVNKGPTVTRYELQPALGVKVSKIVNLADDIALNLAASGIRIEAPIPGKAVVGIEVPNENKQIVLIREVLEHTNYIKFPSKVAFGLGKDVDGNVIVADIAKMPHLLVAGATGSGKSVCINTLIISILYKANPNEVKLILIDPKVVELSIYNGIPHLLIPVVNEPKKAAGALFWAVQEMTNRYKKFAESNVRDIKGFNERVNQLNTGEKMPHLVIIIDELADLMMVSAKEVEEHICRLAQMARAAGIHLVIATQRPSVDVITGVIKANIPSRLAFAVSSGIDSRTILDMNGAEKLLGKGDMLFMPIGASKPTRIQGAFITDKEVENIVKFIKKDYNTQYNEKVIEEIATTKNTGNIKSDEFDEYLEKAIELAIEKQKVSISMFQRVFRIGFNRASRLMEDLYERGIVSAEEGSKPRKVLLTKEQYESMKNNK